MCTCVLGTGTTGLGALANRCCFVGMEKDQRRFLSAVHILARELGSQLSKSG